MELTNTKEFIKLAQQKKGTLTPLEILRFSRLQFTEAMNNAINIAVLNKYDEVINFNTEKSTNEKEHALTCYLEITYNGYEKIRRISGEL